MFTQVRDETTLKRIFDKSDEMWGEIHIRNRTQAITNYSTRNTYQVWFDGEVSVSFKYKSNLEAWRAIGFAYFGITEREALTRLMTYLKEYATKTKEKKVFVKIFNRKAMDTALRNLFTKDRKTTIVEENNMFTRFEITG